MIRAQTFKLHRATDVTGVSGTGNPRSTVVWDSLQDAIAIHGHDGATRVVWDTP